VQSLHRQKKSLRAKVQNVQSWYDFYDFTGDNFPICDDLKTFVLECFIFNNDEILRGYPVIRDLPFILQDKTGRKKVQIFMCHRCGDLKIIIDKGYPSRLCHCPSCKGEHDIELQRIRRAKEKGKELRFCEWIGCGKLLPDKYPNRKYCSGACRTAASRYRNKPPSNWIENPDGTITRFYPIPDDPDIIEYIFEKVMKSNERQIVRGKENKGFTKYGIVRIDD